MSRRQDQFELNPKTAQTNYEHEIDIVVQAQVVDENDNQYDDDNNNSNFSSNPKLDATPNSYFQYNPDILQNDARDRLSSIPIAPAFASVEDESPYAYQHSVARKTKFGSDMGRIHALEEKERIKRASANAKSLPYFESKRVQAGDAVAKERRKEGFVTKSEFYLKEAEREAREAAAAVAVKMKKKASAPPKSTTTGGYQLSDYKVEEYGCKDYETTEYKSVYD